MHVHVRHQGRRRRRRRLGTRQAHRRARLRLQLARDRARRCTAPSWRWTVRSSRRVDGVDAGIASTYSLQMSVPGGSRVPVAGLTWVGVLSTHRRRGVLTAMMRDHLDGLRDEGGEAVAALFAAEPGIYGRFGYGLASTRLKVTIPREFARLLPGARDDDPDVSLRRARGRPPPAGPGQRRRGGARGRACPRAARCGGTGRSTTRRPSAAGRRRCAACWSRTRPARAPTRSTA